MGKITMKRIAKILTALIIIATIATMLSAVFADGASDTLSKLKGNTGAAPTGITTTANNIIGIVQVICYAAAIIMLIILGVQFITASPEGKATIKKSAVIYIVGAIIVFAAGTLLSVISNLSTSVVKES